MNTPSTRAPKIVHATECLASGTLTFLVQASRELAEAGVRQVIVFSRRPDTPNGVEALFDPRVELVEIRALGHAYLAYFQALRGALRVQLADPDVVALHLHSSKCGLMGRLAVQGLRRPPQFFYSPHGLSFLNRRYVIPSLVFQALEWLAARIDCTLVGCSPSETQLLQRLHARPARVLENAVDDSFFGIARREAAVPLIVSMGRICYQKRAEDFAALAQRFRDAGSPARFVWIGNGDAEGEALLRAAGVHVTGWLKRDGILQLLAEASVYVQTSRWEGMPLAVLQALAAGVPCVVRNVVGNRDTIEQGTTGFVMDSLDEGVGYLQRLLEDDLLRARMGAAARRDAQQRFSGASFRARLCGLYGLSTSAASSTAEAPRTDATADARPGMSATA